MEPSRSVLARAFARFASAQSWYRDPDRSVRTAEITDVVPVQAGRYYVVLLRVEFTEGDPGMYSMPVAISSEQNANSIAKLKVGNAGMFLADGSSEPPFANQLLEIVTRRKKLPAENGSLTGQNNRWFRQAVSQAKGSLDPQVEPSAERNTTIRSASNSC